MSDSNLFISPCHAIIMGDSFMEAYMKGNATKEIHLTLNQVLVFELKEHCKFHGLSVEAVIEAAISHLLLDHPKKIITFHKQFKKDFAQDAV